MRLEGKKVIVTGANRSIGKAIALLFAKEGAELVISFRSDQKGAEEIIGCIQKTNGNASALYADFSTHEGVEQFYRECLSILGHIDILVNNAGGYNTLGFFELTTRDFEQLLQVTLMTPLEKLATTTKPQTRDASERVDTKLLILSRSSFSLSLFE